MGTFVSKNPGGLRMLIAPRPDYFAVVIRDGAGRSVYSSRYVTTASIEDIRAHGVPAWNVWIEGGYRADDVSLAVNLYGWNRVKGAGVRIGPKVIVGKMAREVEEATAEL